MSNRSWRNELTIFGTRARQLFYVHLWWNQENICVVGIKFDFGDS